MFPRNSPDGSKVLFTSDHTGVDEYFRIQVFQLGLLGSRQELDRTGVFQPANHLVDDPARGRLYFELLDRPLYGSGARIKYYDKETGTS